MDARLAPHDLSPPDRTASVRDALGRLGEGVLLPVRAVNRGLEVA